MVDVVDPVEPSAQTSVRQPTRSKGDGVSTVFPKPTLGVKLWSPLQPQKHWRSSLDSAGCVTTRSCSLSWTSLTWSAPDRVAAVLAILAQELQRHAHIDLHLGTSCTCCENQMQLCARETRRCPARKGIRMSGAPVGHPDFVLDQLEKKSREHAALFQRIP